MCMHMQICHYATLHAIIRIATTLHEGIKPKFQIVGHLVFGNGKGQIDSTQPGRTPRPYHLHAHAHVRESALPLDCHMFEHDVV